MPRLPDKVPRTDRHHLSAPLLVAAIALVASLAGIENDFAQDDIPLIQNNALFHDLGNVKTLLTSPYWPSPFSPDLYRPFTSIWLTVEYVIGGGTPALFRITSYALYALLAVGVFMLAARLVPRNIAIGFAAIFAAHPVHVEAVAPAVGQSELIVALLAVAMTIRYIDIRRTRALCVSDWTMLGAMYLAASLFKEHGLVLPALLVCVEFLLIPESNANRLRSLAGGIAGFTVIAITVLLARHAVLGDVAGTFTAEALVGLGVGGRALTMLQVVPQWMRLLLWPAHLQADYSPQEFVAATTFGAVQAYGTLLLILALAAFWLSRRRLPVVAFGIGWTAITLFPVSNVLIPTGILFAERTLLLPSVGVCIALAGVVAALWPRFVSSRPAVGRDLAFACAAAVIVGAVRSGERQRVWRNEAFLSVRSVQDAPRSFRTRRAYGNVLFDLDRPEMAIEAYRQAIAFSPHGLQWRMRNDLAQHFRERGERAQEVEQLTASLAQEPRQEDIRGHLISAYLDLGRYADAASAVDSAIAHGAPRAVFDRARAVADSAARVNAPPGSIKVGITTGPSRAVP
ncbi:MAG: hypothetical protein JWM95_1307 [Gemmatimonadetes bacterium]|nr:hypothetical protein [Gemmatimonadota bacterium]